MDFSRVQLTQSQRALIEEVHEFIDTYVTEDVIREDRRTGDLFNESVHQGLGQRGWIMPAWPVERGGAGLDRLSAGILNLELLKAQTPLAITNVTRNVATALEQWASPELRVEVLPRVADGSVRLCLGYTEPDGGSDIASAKTRAQREGDDWVISGSKIFTSGAQVAHYSFLLARTDVAAPKHKGLTMFLVPLSSPGVEIHPIFTYGGERTNSVFYGDVRIPDRYRLGEVNEGWFVLRGPLDREHSVETEVEARQIDDLSAGTWYARALGRALDTAVDWANETIREDGSRPIDDRTVSWRLGQVAVDLQVALVTPGPFGRVHCSDILVHGAAELVDLLSPESLISQGSVDELKNGIVEYTHRFAQSSGTQGGTVEVFRAMIASQMLGLPRPTYPGSKNFLGSKRRDDEDDVSRARSA